MSRIGKQPIIIPSGVEVTVKNGEVAVKGPKGTLKFQPHQKIFVKVEDGKIIVERKSDEILDKSLHGLTRSTIANLVIGVVSGFIKKLEIQGVGYRVQLQDKKLQFSLGFSHPVEYVAPEGISFEIDKEKKNVISVIGIDKVMVGQVASNLRALRPPEPYKGKGIRYLGEIVRRKAGKAATTAAKGAAT